MLQREMPRIYPSSDVAIQLIRQIWIRWTTASGVSFKREVYRWWIHDVKELKERLLSEWRLLDHTIIMAAIVQWHGHLNSCVRVNGGHFEHKFWASDFLLCFVCFIDNGSPKCDRYKHVQSVNIVWNVTFVSETLTQYGSNITNVWQEIFTPVTLAFSCEVVREKLWKSVNICKSYSKKSVAPFSLGHGV